jgi:hypothetical protein
MSQSLVVFTHNGWAVAAYLKLLQAGLVQKDKQGEICAILAPLFEKAEQNAFNHALDSFNEGKGDPCHRP